MTSGAGPDSWSELFAGRNAIYAIILAGGVALERRWKPRDRSRAGTQLECKAVSTVVDGAPRRNAALRSSERCRMM
jgi:hypothetical protein